MSVAQISCGANCLFGNVVFGNDLSVDRNEYSQARSGEGVRLWVKDIICSCIQITAGSRSHEFKLLSLA